MEIDCIHSVMRVERLLFFKAIMSWRINHCSVVSFELRWCWSWTARCINILKVCKLVLEESSCQHLSTSHLICDLGFTSCPCGDSNHIVHNSVIDRYWDLCFLSIHFEINHYLSFCVLRYQYNSFVIVPCIYVTPHATRVGGNKPIYLFQYILMQWKTVELTVIKLTWHKSN